MAEVHGDTVFVYADNKESSIEIASLSGQGQ